jgi:hypothetical protein
MKGTTTGWLLATFYSMTVFQPVPVIVTPVVETGESRSSSVTVICGYRLDDRVAEVRSSADAKGFFL